MKKAITLLLLLFVCEPWAETTTLLRMGLRELTSESHVIVYAKIGGSRTEWNSERTWIYTVYTIHPLEYLKGQLGPVFELQEPGGELDGLSMTVAGVPKLTVGEEAVLFVWSDRRGRHQLTGFQQGLCPVQTDPHTGAKMVDRVIPLRFAQTTAASDPQVRTTSPLLVDLLYQIRSSAAETPRPPAAQ